jgi:hypothetical protein
VTGTGARMSFRLPPAEPTKSWGWDVAGNNMKFTRDGRIVIAVLSIQGIAIPKSHASWRWRLLVDCEWRGEWVDMIAIISKPEWERENERNGR